MKDFRAPPSPVDLAIGHVDRALRAVFGGASGVGRNSPATNVNESDMSEQERRHCVGLMRVNHAGEVAAQALYHGQALTSRRPETRRHLEEAAAEEGDHLNWCRDRLHELGGRTSRLDPLWYGGSFALGALAGLAGDRWSLGFVAETERQVVEHLEGHLRSLPAGDGKSRAVLEQMREDEQQHASDATASGGHELPAPVAKAMRATSKLMTRGAYWL